jgi:hypothetical protein
MGGNAATQTLTVIVRGIALGELTWANSRKALFKEALVGLGNGVSCGIVGALVVWAWKGNPWLGAILCAAMIINMFVAATAGTLIPLALRALKVDSGPRLVGLHHHADRRVRLRLVARPGDDLPQVPASVMLPDLKVRPTSSA